MNQTTRQAFVHVLSADPSRFLIALLLAGVILPAASLRAQEERAEERVSALSVALQQGQQAHLQRVAVWGGLNAAAGLALVLSAGRRAHPARWGFGLQSGLWGAVNLGIALPGLLGGPGDAAVSYPQALSAERTYHDLLLLNMGLNVAYTGVGTALLVAGYRGVRSARAWRGHGAALVVQGAGLLVLDGVALLAARARLADLLRLSTDLTAAAGLRRLAFTLTF